MVFSSGANAHHAIEFGTTSPTSITLNNLDFTGFNASQDVNGSIFHVKRTTGTVTINLVGCTSDVAFASSYRTDGATVVIVEDPVTLTITVSDLDTAAVIENVNVFIPVTSGVNWPYLASVTITGSTTTCTVTHTTHGLSTGDYIFIEGAVEDEYNGSHQITVTGLTCYRNDYSNNGSNKWVNQCIRSHKRHQNIRQRSNYWRKV